MKNKIILKNSALDELPPNIAIPNYDRSKLTAGIVHIGVGGFHRAHQAMYIDELLATPGSEQWAICGMGLQENNRGLYDTLKKQDFLYSLIVRHTNGKIENRIIGSIIDFILAPDNKQSAIDKLAHPDTKIVSLTITEGGYNIHPSTGEFDFTHPDITYDVNNLNDPKTVFGYLTAALKIRQEKSLPAFTIQSCDNIQHNGDMMKKMLLAFITSIDPVLAVWVKTHVKFPNAMVDRITPVTTPADIEYLSNDVGIIDEWPITCEHFSQWVIEDTFSDGRPNWDNVGAQFVQDVTPYETMKIRLLNAGHSVLGLLGSLQGFHTIDETVSSPIFARYLRNFMDVEVTPLLPQLDGIDLNAYKDKLIERFSNPNIKDYLSRICLESSAKIPTFLLATINDNIQKNGSLQYAALVIAAWCYYSDKQTDQQSKPLYIVDEMSNELHQHARKTQQDPLAFLKLKTIFGELAHHQSFTEIYSKAIHELYSNENTIINIMEKTIATSVNVACFGEVLWDKFKQEKKVGGAPLNVCLRLNSYGIKSTMISAVGQDDDGEKLNHLITDKGLSIDFIETTPDYPTSTVDVHLNDQGSATYTIRENVAWDHISLTPSLIEQVKQADIFIFGSLVARSNNGFKNLSRLLEHAKYKVFDVNLRAPHYTIDSLVTLLKKVDFIKFNDDELLEIAQAMGSTFESVAENIHFIVSITKVPTVCVTQGDKGATLFINNKYYRNEGYPITVKDTVGAGDSFLASLIYKLSIGEVPQKAIDFACATGALVAQEQGATPTLSNEDVMALINTKT